MCYLDANDDSPASKAERPMLTSSSALQVVSSTISTEHPVLHSSTSASSSSMRPTGFSHRASKTGSLRSSRRSSRQKHQLKPPRRHSQTSRAWSCRRHQNHKSHVVRLWRRCFCLVFRRNGTTRSIRRARSCYLAPRSLATLRTSQLSVCEILNTSSFKALLLG